MIFFGYKNKAGRIVRGLIFAALGVLFLFFPGSWFSGAAMLIVTRVLGVLLMLFGGFELLVLIGARSVMEMGLLPFLLAAGTVALGVSLLMADGDMRFLKLIAGGALLWYGIGDLVSGWKIGRAIDEYEIKRTREAPKQPSSDEFTVSDLENAKEVEFRKED